MTAAEASALDAARWLAQYVPLYVGPIDDQGDPAGWHGWHRTPVDPNVMDRWRPGLAVGAVGGVTCDFIDVDPRHGGDESARGMREAGLMPRVFGWARTPRGGAHYVIAPLGVGSRDGIFPGVDLKGGKPDGTGRGFVFVAPTVRKGGTYSWAQLPDFDALAEGDETGEALAEHVRGLRPDDGWKKGEAAPRHIGPPTEHEAKYLDGMLRNLAEQMRATPEGRRNSTLFIASMKAGSFAAGAGLNAEHAHAVLTEAAKASGLDGAEIAGTWQSGFGVGERHPRAVPSSSSTDEPKQAKTSDGLRVIEAASVTLERVRFAWADRVPVGGLTLFPGPEDAGKTTLLSSLAASVTVGELDGDLHGTPRHVLVIAPEDHLAAVAVPRLEQAGADLSLVSFVAGAMVSGVEQDVVLPRDLDHLTRLVEQKRTAWVIVDSLVTTLPDGRSTISYQDTAKLLRALRDWAEKVNVAVVAPWHLNKGAGSDTAVRMMDSRAFRTAPRAVLYVVEEPNADTAVVALEKANIVDKRRVKALRFRIERVEYTIIERDPLTGFDLPKLASCGVVKWLGEVDGDGRAYVQKLLAPLTERAVERWLSEYLDEHGDDDGWVSSADIKDASPYSESAVKRASRKLRVEIKDEEFPRRTWWRPSQSGQSGQSGEQENEPDRPVDVTEPLHPNDLTDLTGENRPAPDPRHKPCRTCGNPILLDPANRQQCERCRLAEQKGTSS